jgi:hypothetical protein
MEKVIVLLIGVLLICSLAGAERAESRGTSTWFLSYNTKEKADQLIADYERAGLNTVYAMVWWYRAFYPTDRFPTDPRLDPDFDAVAYLLEECHRRGWSFYAWFVNARVHPRLTQNYDRFGDWLIVNEDGQRDEQRLDYNLPEVREYEKELILDFLARYPRVDGFQFDYIRFPWQGGYSYSERARELFAAEHGYDVRALAGRPESWAEPERKSKEWRQWQRDNIRKLIEAVYTGAKAINPDILVGAAVMGREDWAEQADQPWWEWVEDGLFEFVKTILGWQGAFFLKSHPNGYFLLPPSCSIAAGVVSMIGHSVVPFRQRALALVALVAWVISSHACLLAESGIHFDWGALSHHAPASEADEGTQKGSGDPCCDELASVWTSGEKLIASTTVSFWNTFAAVFEPVRSPRVTGDPAPPDIWPPGGRSFSSQFVGSSLFGRAPPVVG